MILDWPKGHPYKGTAERGDTWVKAPVFDTEGRFCGVRKMGLVGKKRRVSINGIEKPAVFTTVKFRVGSYGLLPTEVIIVPTFKAWRQSLEKTT